MTLLRTAPDPERATAAIAFTTGLEDPATPLAEEEPKRVRDEMHAAWRTFFSALAADRPVVVVVEDIHWADPAMLDLLEELADRVEGGVSFVCPSRPDLTSTRPGWGGGKRNYSAIALDPLGPRDADALVRSLLDVDGLPDSMFGQILDRAEGNPFFLEEIVRQLVDNRSVWLEGGRWRAAGDITQVEIPDTVQGVLAARIDLLDPPDRRVLQAAAVVGRIFWPGAVRQLLNGGGDRMPEALITLEERDLVRSRLSSALGEEPEYIFKHVLTRDVAYDTLPRRDRSAAHASIARWLEDTLGERAREFLELLSYHWFEAYRACSSTDPQEIEALRLQAFDRTLRAAQETGRRYALKKSERLAGQAIDLAATPQERSLAYEASAEAFFNDYDGDEAWRGFTAAAEAELEAEPRDAVRVSRSLGPRRGDRDAMARIDADRPSGIRGAAVPRARDRPPPAGRLPRTCAAPGDQGVVAVRVPGVGLLRRGTGPHRTRRLGGGRHGDPTGRRRPRLGHAGSGDLTLPAPGPLRPCARDRGSSARAGCPGSATRSRSGTCSR